MGPHGGWASSDDDEAPQPWMRQAGCRGYTSTVMYAPDYERAEQREARMAIAEQLCRSCPVFVDCERWVFSFTHDPLADGYAAGMTREERDAERQARRTGVRQLSLLDDRRLVS